jgi:hypothetical protein
VSLADVAFIFGVVVMAPILYVKLPPPIVAGLFLLLASNVLLTLLAAVLRSRWLAWLLTASWLAADVASVWLLGPTHPASTATNNCLLVMLVIGVSLIWAHGGLRARDTAVLVLAVGVYDFVATGASSLTDELVARLASIPLTPVIAWGSGEDAGRLAIGLGDVLLAALFPIVQRKAFGESAGVAGLAVSLTVIALLVWLGAAGVLGRGFPVMVVLAPLVMIQFLGWRWRRRERPWALAA